MPLLSEARRWTRKSRSDSWPGHVRWLSRFHRWKRRALLEHVAPTGSEDVTAIILVYGRPQNADILARLLLRTPSVRRVVLSNNNRMVRIRKWLSVRSPRLHVIDQPIDRPCQYRFDLARRFEAPWYLLVDDDVFLTPSQLERIIAALRDDPSRVHGIQGQLFDPGTGSFRHDIRGDGIPVDVMNRVYAFTHAHLREFYRLVDLLGFGPNSHTWHRSVWDDMVLSFSGSARPFIHDVGPIINCPTHDAPDVAAWRQEGFFAFRVSLFRRLSALKSLSPS